MVKESVNRAFHASFRLEDQKEGMAAFVEKRKANFRNRCFPATSRSAGIFGERWEMLTHLAIFLNWELATKIAGVPNTA
jgi:hypothetical protein